MPKWIIMDNERALGSAAIMCILEDQLKISVHTMPRMYRQVRDK